MADGTVFVAADLGAESGRIMAGTFRGGRVAIEEVHRFANTPVRTPDGLHWDIFHLYVEILHGLSAAAQRYGDAIAGIGVDSWAVDFGLIDRGGRLLGAPFHYRDTRTDGVREAVARVLPPAELYARTGIAHLAFNTLYQLVAQRDGGDETLDIARSLLMIPDLVHYWLTGVEATEFTNASTTGLLDVHGQWASDVLALLELPGRVFLPPSQPGTVLGPLRAAVQAERRLPTIPVILPATHDTACAVVAVPASSRGNGVTHAYISSGTWFLVGLELDAPIVSEEARLAGFTNEGGVCGTYRFLTNIMGLWLLQECRRSWARRGQDWSYVELSARAAAVRTPGIVIDVDDPAFLHPEDMADALQAHLLGTGQRRVEDPAVLARVILESLAVAYRHALAQAERLSGKRVETVHVVGGGARNNLLCQLTADACRRPVLAGPEEATAVGNVLMQAMGSGIVRDLADARKVSSQSARVARYEPRESGDWDDLSERLGALRAQRAGVGAHS